MYRIQSQSKYDGVWKDNGGAGGVFQHGPFATPQDAITWARENFNPQVDGTEHHRWVVVDYDTGEAICTV